MTGTDLRKLKEEIADIKSRLTGAWARIMAHEEEIETLKARRQRAGK